MNRRKLYIRARSDIYIREDEYWLVANNIGVIGFTPTIMSNFEQLHLILKKELEIAREQVLELWNKHFFTVRNT